MFVREEESRKMCISLASIHNLKDLEDTTVKKREIEGEELLREEKERDT